MEDSTRHPMEDGGFKDWVAPLGPYDCLLNAIAFWLAFHRARLDPLFRYNFSIHYSARHDLFDGTIPPQELFGFIQGTYGVEIEACRLELLRSGRVYLLPINAYYLMYMTEYYQQRNMLHYVLAEVESDHSLMITDPSFRKKYSLHVNAVRQAWGTFGEPIVGVGQPLTMNPDTTAIKPYLCAKPYGQIISSTFIQIEQRIMKFGADYDGVDLSHAPMFKKYFGCIRTLALSRLKHVGTYITHDYDHLFSAWRKTEVSFMRMTMSLDRGLTETLDHLKQIAEDEIAYLHSYEKG